MKKCKMNKKGFALIFGLMLATILFLLGMALAPALQQTTKEQMNDLNCSTVTSQQTKAICTSIDMMQLFVPILFGLAGIIIWRLT